jgi:hypothetical protein
MDFEPTKKQQEFLNEPRRFSVLPFKAGRRGGKTRAMEEAIRLDALDAEQADLAIKDLRTQGISMMSNGRRVEPPKRKPTRIYFDESPR